jgi:hypothetical protein
MRRLVRGVALALGFAAGMVLLYVLAALLLGLVPRNPGFVETADGVEIYVRTNGVHADLVVPTQWNGIDWGAEFPAHDMSGLVAPARWIAFGWGDPRFHADNAHLGRSAAGHGLLCSQRPGPGGNAC